MCPWILAGAGTADEKRMMEWLAGLPRDNSAIPACKHESGLNVRPFSEYPTRRLMTGRQEDSNWRQRRWNPAF